MSVLARISAFARAAVSAPRLMGRGRGEAPRAGQLSQYVFSGIPAGHYLGPGGYDLSEWLGPYTPHHVPLGILKIMRDDPQIALALAAFKSPFYGIEYFLDGGSQSARAFVKKTLLERPVFLRLLSSILNAVDYGFQSDELIWKTEDVALDPDGDGPAAPEIYPLAYVLADIFDLDPAHVSEICVDDYGNLAGVQTAMGGLDRYLPSEKLLHCVYQLEHRNWLGRSRLKPAYNPFFWSNWLYRYLMRYMEGRAEPPLIGTAPNEWRPVKGQDKEEYCPEVMGGIMASLRNGSAAVIPQEYDPETKLPRWTIDVLKDSGRTDTFLSVIEHMQALKLRACLMPERVATQEGSVGSYASSQVHLDVFFSNMESTKRLLVLDRLNAVVELVVRTQFGQSVSVPRIKCADLSRDSKELLGSVVTTLLTTDRITADGKAYKGGDAVDLFGALASLNIPRRTAEQIGRRGVVPPAPPALVGPGAKATAPTASPSPSAAPVVAASAGRAELLNTVGGITGAISIAEQVSRGTLTREAAVNMITLFFQVTRPEAEALIVGVEPRPSQPQRPPETALALSSPDRWEHKIGAPAATLAPEARDSCGVFLPVPPALASLFPAKPQDSSRPHATLLFVGTLTRDRFFELVGLVRAAVSRFGPFTVELTDYGEFMSEKGQKIAHMIPRAPQLEEIHLALREVCDRAGLVVEHHPGFFKPHVTLGYLEPSASFAGPRPSGSWTADSLEVWGFEDVRVVLSGQPVTPPS